MKASALTKYLAQLERTEDEFAMQQSLDSSTWNMADARNVANFYSSQLAYAKAVIRQAADQLVVHETGIEAELMVVDETIREWKAGLPEGWLK